MAVLRAAFDKLFERFNLNYRLPLRLKEREREAYFETLKDLEIGPLAIAARRLVSKSPDAFPNAGEWRNEAVAIDPLTIDPSHDGNHWTFHECPTERCDRQFKHAPHTYVRRRES